MGKFRNSLLLLLIFIFVFFVINSFFRSLNIYSYRYLYLGKKQKDLNPKIVVLALDDFTAKTLKTKTVPSRKVFAEAINHLRQLKVKGIVFDVIFKGKTPDDAILAQAMKNANNVVISSYEWDKSTLSADNFYQTINVKEKILKGKEDNYAYSLIPEIIRKSAFGIGMIHISEDIIMKDIYPFIQIGKKLYPRLFIKTIELLENQKAILTKEKVIIGTKKIPLTKDGKVIINYQVSELEKISKWYPFYLVVGKNWKKQTKNLDFKDKIVFIIPASFSYHDVVNAPYFADASTSFMFGGLIHLNLVNQILNNCYLKEIPHNYSKLLSFLVFSFLFFLFYKIKFIKALFFMIIIMIIFPTVSVFLFLNYNLIGLNFILLDIVTFLSFSTSFIFRYIKELQVKKMFRQYVGDAILNEVIKLEEKDSLFKGQEKELTVFLMDIRGFTALSSRLSPQKIVSILNSFFNSVTNILLKHEGTIDKFMGDAILAFFGAPIDIKNKEEKAILAAQEIIKLLDKKEFDGEKLRIGIAITTGKVIVGNIGSEKKIEYTIIGPAVNLASRLESYNKIFKTQLIFDENTKLKIEEKMECTFLGKEKIRGIEKEQRLYTLKKIY